MAKSPTIFISYNPKASQEETLAVRLQTIGAVNGFRTFLPDRFVGKNYVDDETIRRIRESDYFVIFASHKISKIVQDEIDIAFQHFQDPSKIIIIYNRQLVPNLRLQDKSAGTLISFDPLNETVDIVIKKVVRQIVRKERDKSRKETENGLLALIGVGLGLWALSTMFSED